MVTPDGSRFDPAIPLLAVNRDAPIMDTISSKHLIQSDSDSGLRSLARDFDVLRGSIAQKMHDAQERYLLEVFGSYEKAAEVAHLYVFEPGQMEFSPQPENDVYKVSFNYRIRPKTPAELEADRLSKEAAEAQEGATKAKDEIEIHEWTWSQFQFAGWIECLCGYRPNNQEGMDAHIPPVATQ